MLDKRDIPSTLPKKTRKMPYLLLGFALLAVGIIAMVMATNMSTAAYNSTMTIDESQPVMCNGQQMQPGDTCQITVYQNGQSSSFDNDYDQQRQYEQKKNLQSQSDVYGAVGAILTLFSIVVIITALRQK